MLTFNLNVCFTYYGLSYQLNGHPLGHKISRRHDVLSTVVRASLHPALPLEVTEETSKHPHNPTRNVNFLSML
jgi:hypothetical protein